MPAQPGDNPPTDVEGARRMDASGAWWYDLLLARDDDIIVGAYRPTRDGWHKLAGACWWFFPVEPANDVWDDYVGKLLPPGVVNSSDLPVVEYLSE